MEKGNETYPKVSVVVPVKNGAVHIKDLLDSLMRVDYDHDKLEIVIVDGNSTDRTKEIASKYPVKFILEEKPGINAARNTGVKNSNGEIIAFTDHDCIVPKNWIKKIVENFQDPKVGCVGGSVLRYNNDFLAQYADESILPVLRFFKKKAVINRISSPMYFPVGCNFAVKREAIEKVGFFDERFKNGFDELEFAERLCEMGYKIVLTNEMIVKHKHRSSMRELLRQTFHYGQGGGLLPKIKGVKSIFSKWVILSLTVFTLWFLTLFSLAVYTFFSHSILSLITFLGLLFFPLFGLMTLYAYRTFKSKDGKYKRIIAYPMIDIARSLTFVAGGIHQIVRSVGTNRFGGLPARHLNVKAKR